MFDPRSTFSSDLPGATARRLRESPCIDLMLTDFHLAGGTSYCELVLTGEVEIRHDDPNTQPPNGIVIACKQLPSQQLVLLIQETFGSGE